MNSSIHAPESARANPPRRPAIHRWLGLLGLALLVAACGGGQSASISDAAANSSAEISATGVDTGSASPAAGVVDAPTERIIVKLKANPLTVQYERIAAEFATSFSRDAGVQLSAVRENFSGAHVLRLPAASTDAQVRVITDRLAKRPDVEYAEPDTRVFTQLLPNDARFSEQWDLREPASVRGGANLLDAWDLTQGDPNLVMAVVDTGVLPHSDLGGRLIAGFDFISDVFSANDGNARDASAFDAGDWLTASEARRFGLPAASNSSFHGTHVAGIMGATGNNAAGVAGVNWKSKVLPIRALGKGGGSTSDISDGIAWAAGVSVPGAGVNPSPAKVINLSLGGTGACPRTTQDAINAATARGAVVVVAAGNSNVNAAQTNPANCAGVIAVAAVGRDGQRAAYSNFGSVVTLAAPGGSDGQTILSLGDGGRQSPLGDNIYVGYQGTSMATPVVAGVVSLMLSVNPSLTPAQVKSILTSTARPFPTGTGRDCSTSQCGAGIVNAGSAVKAAASAINGGGNGVLSAPQSGWWLNQNEPGRGFAIEIKSGKLFFGGFLYDAAGNATWNVSGPSQMQSATDFTGTLDVYGGGPTLSGAFKSASLTGSQGQLTIKFTGPGTGVLTWPGGAIPIKRFEFSPGGLSTVKTTFAPENGWWLNPEEPGRGYAIEVQGNQLFAAGFMYDAAGKPVWHLTSGPLSSPTEYNGVWVQYGGGQALGGAFRPAGITNPNLGAVKMQFTSTAKGNLTLPNGRVIPIEKFDIGFRSPFAVVNPNKVQTSRLLGLWAISYTIISTFVDNFLFDTVVESSSTPGEYFVYGVNQFDQAAIGGWFPEDQSYAILVPNDFANFDDFYAIDAITNDTMTGCFYLAYKEPSRLSACYPLFGSRSAQGSIAPLGLSSEGRAAVLAARRKAIEQESTRASTVAGTQSKAMVQSAGSPQAATAQFEALRRARAIAPAVRTP